MRCVLPYRVCRVSICLVRFHGVRLCAAVALLSAVGLRAGAETVDLTKRYPTGTAPIVQNKTGAVPMFASAGKKAKIGQKVKVTHAEKKQAGVTTVGGTTNLDPRHVGAKKISMQQFNRYAYRKSNSSKPGVPVTKAAGGEEIVK